MSNPWDSDSYRCMCGETIYESCLVSARDGTRMMECCEEQGWQRVQLSPIVHTYIKKVVD